MTADDIWNDLFGGFDSLNRRIEDMFRSADVSGPDVRTYGYTMWQGPDGVRHVREFGNSGSGLGALQAPGREPFTDVSEEGDLVRVVAEIPGAEKQDIELSGTRDVLSIRVSTPGREFSRDLALPCDVDVDSAKAEYNNGLLEVVLDRVKPTDGGRRIPVS